MGTYEYQKTMAEISGEPEIELPKGVTHVTKDFSGDSNEWNATVYFRDAVPTHITFYIWAASDENIKNGLQEMIGLNYKVINRGGGNGHYYADVAPRVST